VNQPDTHTLLICTVGGTHEPLVKTLRHWKPKKVVFLPSEETQSRIDSVLRAFAEHEESPLSPGCYEVRPVDDAQDLLACIRSFQRLAETVGDWRKRGGDYRVVVDITAGTKCMSAALALVARRWPCRFAYVGGTRRDKEGAGVVQPGFEQVLHNDNPWNALGYQAIEEACTLFDRNAFAAAAALLQTARTAADDKAVKRTLSTFDQICQAYDKWDRFQHEGALKELENALKNDNDIRTTLGDSRSDSFLKCMNENTRHLKGLRANAGEAPPDGIVPDLLANAQRRADEGRYDDAVARLYRAIEATAQLRLKREHKLETANTPREALPEPLRREWEHRAENGTVRLGLQDAYRLLRELGDPLGTEFERMELTHPVKSPLNARNNSILAHGFHPAKEDVFNRLWGAAINLAGCNEDALPRFPSLTEKGA